MALPRRPLRRWIALVTVVPLLAVVRRLRSAAGRADGVPLSPLTAGARVGADYLERRGIPTAGAVPGEVDDFSVFARPGFDPEAVHPDVRRFYERTAEYALAYRVTWHRGFRLGAWLATRLTRRIGQLNLPGPGEDGGTMHSRLVAVDPSADPREGARAWIRTDEATGEAVFVAVYALHRDGEEVYTNIAAPLPGGNLSTVLRVESIPTDGEGDGDGVRFTTRGGGDEGGLYLVTPVGAFALPLEQTFEVWPADAPGAPRVEGRDEAADDRSDAEEASVVATHEMWVYGRKFLTIEYAARPGPEASR